MRGIGERVWRRYNRDGGDMRQEKNYRAQHEKTLQGKNNNKKGEAR